MSQGASCFGWAIAGTGGGGGGSLTWAQTLANGNPSGGTNPVLSIDDEIEVASSVGSPTQIVWVAQNDSNTNVTLSGNGVSINLNATTSVVVNTGSAFNVGTGTGTHSYTGAFSLDAAGITLDSSVTMLYKGVLSTLTHSFQRDSGNGKVILLPNKVADGVNTRICLENDGGIGTIQNCIVNSTSTASRTWQLPDVSGTFVLGTGTSPRAARWTGTNTIGDGTWEFSGNDYIPTTSGSNLGSATNTIDTIFMASTIDYGNDLTFVSSSSTRMTLTTGGNLGIGIAPAATSRLHVDGNDVQIEGASVTDLFYVDYSANEVGIHTSNPSAQFHVVSVSGTGAASNLLLENSTGLDLMRVRNDGLIQFNTTSTSYNWAGVGEAINASNNSFPSFTSWYWRSQQAGYNPSDNTTLVLWEGKLGNINATEFNSFHFRSGPLVTGTNSNVMLIENYNPSGSGSTVSSTHAMFRILTGYSQVGSVNKVAMTVGVFGRTALGDQQDGDLNEGSQLYVNHVLRDYTSTIGDNQTIRCVNTVAQSLNSTSSFIKHGMTIDVSGTWTNAGTGVLTAVGLEINVAGGDVNYGLLVDGGNSGFGTDAPVSFVTVDGGDIEIVGTTDGVIMEDRTNNTRNRLYMDDDGGGNTTLFIESA